MNLHNFIFENNNRYKNMRHIFFWIARIFFLTSIHTFFFYDTERSFSTNYLASLKFIPLLVLFAEPGYCYFVVYFLIPKYFQRKRYGFFFITLAATTLISSLATAFVPFFYFHLQTSIKTYDDLLVFLWHQTNMYIFGGPPTVCALFIMFKMLRTWYIEDQQKQLLLRENAAAELQLLKAQIHPHFFFNTLNNIYSFALTKSIKASEMVMQLSNIMKYMINDCATDFVYLSKEFQMMDDYIGLEKVRYGNSLKIQMHIEGDYDDKMIAPLFMIPFLENSFKHGASKLLRDPWIELFIQVDKNVLHFSLSNSRPSSKDRTVKGGIGLTNVKKRLELLYPQNHLLLIEETENTFAVNMQVPIFAASTEPIKQSMYAT